MNHPRPNMSMFDSSKNPSDSYFWNRQSFADKNKQKGNWQELSCIGYEFVFACLPRLQGLIPAANLRRLRMRSASVCQAMPKTSMCYPVFAEWGASIRRIWIL